MMNPIQIVVGIIAGIVGAAIWAAIAYYAHVEVGYVAIGIGALIGFVIASTGKNSTMAGIGAALITIVSLVGGKYATIELAMQNNFGTFEEAMSKFKADSTDNDLVVWVSHGIVAEREGAGEQLDWPRGMDAEVASVLSDFPEDVREQADAYWNSLTPEEKDENREEYFSLVAENAKGEWEANENETRQNGFLASFGIFDLLFFAIAIGAAWGIASKDEEEAVTSAPIDQFPPPIDHA